jgi:hypothetical protein
MLTDNQIMFTYEETPGVALVWVLDDQCLYDLPLSVEHSEIFLNTNSVVDVSADYPDNDGLTLEIKQDNVILEVFNTNEYFGNILLSDPLVLKLSDYPYGRYVQSPDATFDGEKFIITNRNLTGYLP